MTKRVTELPALTGIRGIAASWVAFGHLLQGDPPFPIYSYLSVLWVNVHVPVELFFILSGFIMMHVYAHPALFRDRWWVLRFLSARFSRLYPAYVVSIFLLIGPRIIGSCLHMTEESHTLNLYHLGVNLVLLQGWGLNVPSLVSPEWSVSVEVFAYIIVFPFFVKIYLAMKSWWQHLIVAASCIAGLVCLGWPTPYLLWVVSLEFVLGASCYGLRVSLGERARKFAWVNDLVFIILVMSLFLNYWNNPFGRVLTVLSLGLWIWGLSYARCWIGRLLSTRAFVWLGLISYSLYVVHDTAYHYMWKVVKLRPTLHAYGAEVFGLGVLAYFIAAVLIAAAMYYFLECPAREFLRSWFDRLLKREGTTKEPISIADGRG